MHVAKLHPLRKMVILCADSITGSIHYGLGYPYMGQTCYQKGSCRMFIVAEIHKIIF